MTPSFPYRQLAALVLLTLFLAQYFNRALIIADYFAHSSAYARICENQFRPELRCYGKCVVVRKLKQEDNKDSENPGRKAEVRDEFSLTYRSAHSGFLLANCLTTTVLIFCPFRSSPLADRTNDIFHPPCA